MPYGTSTYTKEELRRWARNYRWLIALTNALNDAILVPMFVANVGGKLCLRIYRAKGGKSKMDVHFWKPITTLDDEERFTRGLKLAKFPYNVEVLEDAYYVIERMSKEEFDETLRKNALSNKEAKRLLDELRPLLDKTIKEVIEERQKTRRYSK